MIKTEKKIVVIRTDGGNEIGMGHISRTLYLANEFKSKGYSVHFITSNNFRSILGKSGKCHIIKNDHNKEIKLIKKLSPKFFILDILKNFFPYKSNYFLELKKIPTKLIAIDFVSKDLKYFDISFHSLFSPKNFKAKKTYYDLKYSIVSDIFKQKSIHYKIKKNVSSIIILCGGSDTNCICPKILNALRNLDTKIKLNLIVGQKFQCWNELNKISKIIENPLKISHNVKNIENLMGQNQIAITAAGVTMTELLTIGIPCLIVYGATHERDAALLVEKNNLAKNIGFGKTISNKDIVSSVNNLILDHNLRKNLHKNSKMIFDGNGLKRIMKILLE